MNRQDQLRRMEGREYKAYPDPLTKGAPWTIGIGHTGVEVHEGLVWTDSQIELAFAQDDRVAEEECRLHFDFWDKLNEPRQAVLWNMCFQMGIGRLLKFKRALAYIGSERWPQAAGEMLDSAWKNQTPKRAARLARQMETGDWQ